MCGLIFARDLAGHGQDKPATLPGNRADHQIALEYVAGDPSAYGQPETGTALAKLGGEKRIKNMCKRVTVQSGSVVSHTQPDFVIFGLGTETDPA